MNKLNIIVAQLNFTVGAIEANAQRIVETAQRCAQEYQADLVVFPELALTGYPPEDLLYRPALYERCQQALKNLAANIKNTAIIVGYPDKQGDKLYNQLAFIEKGEIKARYSKQDLPNYTVFDEKRYFTAGNQCCVVDYKGSRLGLAICEDLWNPQIARDIQQAGAELIISINASPYDRYKVKARETMLKARVHDIQIPIIYANLVGGQDELVFDGGSMVVDAKGNRVQQAPYYQECLMPVCWEPQDLPAHLSEEENIYQALVMGVRDYIQKNHFKGALLGLSGGIDSALTLAIAADAIGAENVHAVMMPSRYTASMSCDDAEEEAKTLGVSYEVIEIEKIFEQFLQTLNPIFEGHPVDATEENIQARIRGTLLMALSNKFGKIVLTTGNKSEMSVGYATLYGDMAGGFAVLKDIPKTLVYQLARYRNQISPVIPERVITRAPSAELRADQTDQDSLPDYDTLDAILDCYIEQDLDPANIIQRGFDAEIVNKITRLVDRNEYKRRQAPPGVRISERAFGKDRRYPITSGYLNCAL